MGRIVIRQICPHCQEAVEFPDDAAGTTRACPECNAAFAIPARYTPRVDPTLSFAPEPESPPAAAPPGFRDPPKRPAHQPGPQLALPPRAAPGSGRGVALDPDALDWFPAGCFTLILLLTLFPWVGLYPGGYEAYSQGPWRATVGRFATDSFAESVIGKQTQLDKYTYANWIMVVYLVGLLAATVISWLDKAFADDRPGRGKLGVLEAIWPHRFPILAGLALGLLALILIQTSAGIGLESGAERMVAAEAAERASEDAKRPGAAPVTAASLQERDIRRGMDLGKYEVHTTIWLGLVIGTHAVAVVAVGLRLWLYRRGSKPLPRLVYEG